MSIEFIVTALSVGLVVWLFYRLDALSQALDEEKQKHQKLRKKFDKLERKLFTRGRRLDVLLSTVTEVVLRVDKLGRVLGGNTQASDLFQFGRFPKLPQAMVIFYRDHEWLSAYQKAVEALPLQLPLPEIKIRDRVFLPRLAALGDNEALLLCMDVTAFMQLQQKQKSLLENLMHDLKTPLTSLLGYARSIEAFADDEALLAEAVSVIAKEAKHINDLMNSMLTLNLIEHQLGVFIEPCDVVDVNRQIWSVLQAQMKEKGITLDLHCDKQEIKVKMAEADCHRVLMNIAENALKFSPKGSTIQCFIEGSEEKVCITITDHGLGIAEKHLSRVTERFYRVDDVRGQVNKDGHGLGLAIVKETLERDGGDLKLQNVENAGLQVSIHIPLV